MTDLKTTVNKHSTAQEELESSHERLEQLISNEQAQLLSHFKTFTVENVRDQIINLKTDFGDIFYKVLCPINGFALKNRRYSDGSHVNRGHQTPEGPAVHQKIGTVGNWSAKANWYESSQVWNKLSQDHVDLVENGIKARKDNHEIAQDFLNYRDEIKELISEGSGKKISRLGFTLEKPITVDLVHYERKGYSSKRRDVHGMNTAVIEKGEVRTDKVVMPVAFDYDKQFADQNGLPFPAKKDKTVEISLTEPEITGEVDWDNKFLAFGLEPIISLPVIKDNYAQMLLQYQEALDKFQELKDKYAGVVVCKGLF